VLNSSVYSAPDKHEVKEKIAKICREVGASIPVVMAIAQIESNINPTAKRNGKDGCVGLFQLQSGYGGCIGDDRLDIEKSIKCLHLNHQKLKARWLKEFGTWDDFYYYGIHQKGYSGFKELYKNRDKLLADLTPTRRQSVLASKPRKADWKRVTDWWDYYEKKFYKVYNQYKKGLTRYL
jgi:hypothetical protein